MRKKKDIGTLQGKDGTDFGKVGLIAKRNAESGIPKIVDLNILSGLVNAFFSR